MHVAEVGLAASSCELFIRTIVTCGRIVTLLRTLQRCRRQRITSCAITAPLSLRLMHMDRCGVFVTFFAIICTTAARAHACSYNILDIEANARSPGATRSTTSRRAKTNDQPPRRATEKMRSAAWTTMALLGLWQAADNEPTWCLEATWSGGE